MNGPHFCAEFSFVTSAISPSLGVELKSPVSMHGDPRDMARILDNIRYKPSFRAFVDS
jgi:hypothetical protein